jgi:hypothetical protein
VCMQEGGDRWKEAANACGEGTPNDSRVRVRGSEVQKSMIDINIGKKESKKGSEVQKFGDFM